jgi:transposase
MFRARVAVLKVVSKQAPAGAVAAEYGLSRRHLQRLLARYRQGGLEALEPRSRKPRTNPNQTPQAVRDLDLTRFGGQVRSMRQVAVGRLLLG